MRQLLRPRSGTELVFSIVLTAGGVAIIIPSARAWPSMPLALLLLALALGVPAFADARRGHNIISFVRLTFAVVILGSGSIALMLGMFLS